MTSRSVLRAARKAAERPAHRKFHAASRRRAKAIRRAKPSEARAPGKQRRAKTSRLGFTLLEVMAAVLVLGLLYTVLASRALIALRSEGNDRRRADAEMIADREMTEIETELRGELPPEDGLFESEEAPYKVISNIEPFDVLPLLPAPLYKEIARRTDPKAPSLLHDERGQSRVRKISVVVEWDESGEPAHVERTTFAFDTSVLAEYFPSGQGEGVETAGSPEVEMEKLRRIVPPELRALMPPGPAQSPTGRGRRAGRLQ
ncbi:MAG: type IV pilus modification PilV family protein [Myxococcota bacterium]